MNKNNITLELNHHDKERVEYFLNNVEERLEQIPFDAKQLSQGDDIIAGFKFKGIDLAITVTVILATSYFHASEIATANSFDKIPNTRWTINGYLLFVVESPDEHAVSEMLSFFAGRE